MVIRIDYKYLIAFLIILLAFALAWLSYDYLSYKRYQLVIQQSVSGLTTGAPVEFNGVVVGSVFKISFEPHHPNKIRVLLKVKNTTPITQGTLANLEISEVITEKFTGFPYIFVALSDSGQNMNPLKIKGLENYATIPMMSQTDHAGKKNTALTRISHSLERSHSLLEPLFSDENIESLKQLAYSLKQVTNILSANSEKLNTILVNSASASKHVEPFLISGNNAMDMLNTEVKPFLQSTNETMQMLKSQTLPKIYDLTSQLNNTLRQLQRLVKKINNNPSVLLRGQALPKLGPGERLNSKKNFR